MGKKKFTFIIVPHCAEKFRCLTFSGKTLNIFLSFSILFAIALVGFLVDYFTMNVTRAKYRQLLRENAEQKRVLSEFQASVSKLKDTIQTYKTYTEKLNVMLGLKSSEVLKEFWIGGGDTEGLETEGMPAGPQLVQKPNLQDAKDLTGKAEEIGKNLDLLVNFSEIRTAQLASTPTIWPTYGWVSSPFAYRTDPFTGKRTFHYGIDIATNFGNPVVATADGMVLTLGNDKTSGRYVVLNHGGGLTTHYLHLSKTLVKPGQRIKRGDVIGLVGKSGKAIGPHLHYEVRLNNRPVNPYRYILEE